MNKKFYILSTLLLSQTSSLLEAKTIKINNTVKSINVVNSKKDNKFINKFNHSFYQPWRQKRNIYKLKEVMWPFYTYAKKTTYAENLLPHKNNFFKKLKVNSNFDKFGNISKRGIAVERLKLRNFPTNKPIFYKPTKPGEGFPFDYNQNSAVHPNEPIFISHFSKDRKYVYVNTSYAGGWVDVRKIAIVSQKLINKIKHLNKLVITKDDVSIINKDKFHVFNSKIGMVLPILEEKSNYYKVLFVSRKDILAPKIEVINIPKSISNIMKNTFIDTDKIKKISKTMLGNPYGWGGLLDDRDCSSTIKDLLATSGYWLPRNSRSISLKGKRKNIKKMSRSNKEAYIINNGIPYKTVLYMRGHIMLYIGTENGMAKIFHDMWGVGYIKNGVYKKKVTGRTVETNLYIGKELNKKRFIVDSLTHMSIF
jgi:hypothetical protein